MIEKMKFLSITGPKEDIDRVVEQYLSKYEIHLENALAELKTVQTLTPFIQINPYKAHLKKAQELVALLPSDLRKEGRSMSLKKALNCIDEMNKPLVRLRNQKESLLEERKKHQELLDEITPFTEFSYELAQIHNFRFIRSRFGRIPQEHYAQFENYVYDTSDSLFFRCHSDRQYVWGVYFTPGTNHEKIDAMYTSMHFERTWLDDALRGTPEEEYEKNRDAIAALDKQISECDDKIASLLNDKAAELVGSVNTLDSYSENFDVRKLAACTRAQRETFYILCGWMASADADRFEKEVSGDASIFCLIEDNDSITTAKPPTKLKNPKFFQPFEMFVRMYGLPGYHEFDPTIYLALTYCFIFGIMFGDAGQGLCFVIGGFLLYRLKGTPLAAIMGTAGIFSVVFGLIYNSFFGFEDFFPYKSLLHAKDDMITLPGLGSLNTVFVLAIAFGMIMILLNMILGIVNAVRKHDAENTFFSQNALAGVIFYGCIVVMVFLVMSGKMTIGRLIPFIIIPLVASLVVIFLKEMLTRAVMHNKPIIEGGKGMYFVQAFFETFETLLSYLSNTLSYIRIGAYAVSHVAMMQVVMMLAGAEAGGNPNLVVLIIGNIFVAAMEGLMVAIQVLRLEYYEMFSRFYIGDGRAFKPFIKKIPRQDVANKEV